MSTICLDPNKENMDPARPQRDYRMRLSFAEFQAASAAASSSSPQPPPQLHFSPPQLPPPAAAPREREAACTQDLWDRPDIETMRVYQNDDLSPAEAVDMFFSPSATLRSLDHLIARGAAESALAVPVPMSVRILFRSDVRPTPVPEMCLCLGGFLASLMTNLSTFYAPRFVCNAQSPTSAFDVRRGRTPTHPLSTYIASVVRRFFPLRSFLRDPEGFSYLASYIAYLVGKLVVVSGYTVPLTLTSSYRIFATAFYIVDTYSHDRCYELAYYCTAFGMQHAELDALVKLFYRGIDFYVPSILSPQMALEAQMCFPPPSTSEAILRVMGF